MNRFYDRARNRRAFDVDEHDAIDGDFEALRGHNYALLVTFRRSGQPVPSPVWFGLDAEGRAFVETEPGTGKLKRIHNDPRALIAPSSVRGNPKGPAVRGTARVLPESEWPHAEQTLAAAYGLGRKLYERAFMRGGPASHTYLEIVPRR